MIKKSEAPKTGILCEAWAKSDLAQIETVHTAAVTLVKAAKKNRRQQGQCAEANARSALRGMASYIPRSVPDNVDWAVVQTKELAERADALGLINLNAMRRASLSCDWREVAPHIKKQAQRAIRGLKHPDKHRPLSRPLYGDCAKGLS